MVEMRWVERVRKNLPPDFNALSPNAKEKVLQYRYHAPTVDASGSLTPFGSWSEWIDVPTVKEG
jgi:hypothetical protein